MKSLPFYDKMIQLGDDSIEPYRSDTMMTGSPEAVYRARDLKELKEIFVYCYNQKVSVTFCGNQTSLTGSSVAEEGLLISTEKMEEIIDIDYNVSDPLARAEPGIFLSEFQDALSQEGFFYPPDPTSRKEARLGATVATNATGEDSLFYGSTRCYVRGLKVVLADGTEQTFSRSKQEQPHKGKNRAGYYLESQNPIDLFIGSEGTLGFISEITVGLLSNPPEYFSGIIFFASLSSALKFVVSLLSKKSLSPRCLELVDQNCLSLIKSYPDCFSIPKSARAALYFKQEYSSHIDRDHLLDEWSAHLSDRFKEDSSPSFLDDTLVAFDTKGKDHLRELRYRIPARLNEISHSYKKEGGGKVSTDWWVPPKKIEEALQEALKESQLLGMTSYIFGHIGNGHPHINYLTKNAEEIQRAQQLVLHQCQRAVSWGGGVAGEHGIGKLKRHLMAIQHPVSILEKMKALKRHYDPHWILGRNTLFPCSGF